MCSASPLCALLFALSVGIWLTMFDADFITFTYDLHRKITQNNDIANKSVWIIGASSGIGEFLVYELIRSGCKKLIISSRREKQLQRVKRTALTMAENEQDIQIIIKTLDLLDFATKDGYSDQFVEETMKTSPFNNMIDILVVNSGMIQVGYGQDNDINVLQRVLDINTVGPIALIQSMIRYWQKIDPDALKTYQVALTSSIAGKMGSPRQSAYSMSKFGVNGYLETLRMELINDGIEINLFNPGHIELNKYSLNAKGSSLDESEEVKRGQNNEDKGRMTLRRCAELYVTVLEYSITDSVVSTNPVLVFTYIKQYLPGLYHPITRLVLPIFDEKYRKPK